MLNAILPFLNFTQLWVVISFITVLMFRNPNNANDKILLLIMLNALITELLSMYLLLRNLPYNLLHSLSILINHSLWLLILSRSIKNGLLAKTVTIGFIAFALTNLLFMEGHVYFNYYSFVFGAFLYILIFILLSFYHLKRENFDFFLATNYLLLFAPVFFLLGLSFIFGFHSKTLSTTIVFGSTTLHALIILVVNTLYYTLVNAYIYRQKKMSHAV